LIDTSMSVRATSSLDGRSASLARLRQHAASRTLIRRGDRCLLIVHNGQAHSYVLFTSSSRLVITRPASALPPLFCHIMAALFPFDHANGRPICD
jgi:hypothetical protein